MRNTSSWFTLVLVAVAGMTTTGWCAAPAALLEAGAASLSSTEPTTATSTESVPSAEPTIATSSASVPSAEPTTATSSAEVALPETVAAGLRNVSTGFLTTVRRPYLEALSPAERTALLAVVKERQAQWQGFGTKGGAASRVLGNLRYLSAALEDLVAKDAEQAKVATDGKPARSLLSPEDVLAESRTGDDPFADCYPPSCNFKVERGLGDARDGAVTISQYNYFDYDDPVSGLASGARKVRFSNDGKNWTTFEPKGKVRPLEWKLAPGPGVKTIYMQACDNQGNWGNADGGPANCATVKVTVK